MLKLGIKQAAQFPAWFSEFDIDENKPLTELAVPIQRWFNEVAELTRDSLSYNEERLKDTLYELVDRVKIPISQWQEEAGDRREAASHARAISARSTSLFKLC
jgi:hypothetical protein